MRTLRPALAGVVTLALLAGLSGAAVAQDEDDPPVTATYVTGNATSNRDLAQGGYSYVDGVDQIRDAVFEHDIDWSDPRLPSLMRISENLNIHLAEGDLGAYVWVGDIRLEGSEGAWTGPEYGLGEDSATGMVLQPRTMLLRGEGAYEGLSAMFHRRWEPGEYTRPILEGYIFEGDMPPMPDPLEPLAD